MPAGVHLKGSNVLCMSNLQTCMFRPSMYGPFKSINSIKHPVRGGGVGGGVQYMDPQLNVTVRAQGGSHLERPLPTKVSRAEMLLAGPGHPITHART